MLALVGPAVSSQLRVLLLTITVVDDIVAVSVIGIAYTDRIAWGPLLVAIAALIGMVILDRLNAWRAGPYVVLVVIAWLATMGSGLHASIAGMLAGLLVPAALPTRTRVESAAQQFRLFRQSPLSVTQRQARDELTRTISVNDRLQASLQTVTSFVIIPIFAFANAGVDLRGGVLAEALTSPVTWGVVVGLVVGKALGISLGAFAATRFGWGRLPQGVRGGHLVGGATLSGIGFTVSLLIANLAFTHDELRRDAVIGVLLAAVTASVLGWIVFAFAARVLGHRDAGLPTTLSEPVDPERDHIRGPVDAGFTLVEYLDFECPFCARTTGVAREVREHFGDRLRYVVRHFPLDEVHPHSELAALGAEAARRQGRFWDMHDVLFANQHELEPEDLARYAGELGLNVEDFLGDLDDGELAARLAEDRRSGGASGVRGTPTFFIGDERHEGRFDSTALIEALEEHARRGDER